MTSGNKHRPSARSHYRGAPAAQRPPAVTGWRPSTEDAWPQTLTGLLRRAAARWPVRPAIRSVPDACELTFDELESAVERTAEFLAGDLGVQPGDRVAAMMANRVEFPLIWLACARIGALLVPVNCGYRQLDASYVLQHSGACVVIADRDSAEVIAAVMGSCTDLRRLVTTDQVPWRGQPTRKLPLLTAVAETVVNVQYTSGTTGRPKGCLLGNAFWLTMARKNVTEVPGLTEADVLLTTQPFTYLDPMWNLAAAIGAGACLVVLDRFHPSSIWRSLHEHRATFFYCIGVMPMLMLKTDGGQFERDHSLRMIACSGIPPAIHAELEERFSVPWLETYGMTEIGNGAAMSLKDHDARVGSGAVGTSTSGRELRVVDDIGMALPRGRTGELVVRGTGLMDGYFRDAEATSAAFRDGWFHTGDRAHLDPEGFLFIHGRAKDAIRRSGENIAATEVEEAIQLHSAVKLAACVPVPDLLRGEEVKAYVVCGAPSEDWPELCELVLPEHTAAMLARFKVPRYWEIRESLPLTASGKVAKHALLAEQDDLRIGTWDRVDRQWR